MAEDVFAPNHHCDHPGFSGLSGLVAAITFTRGRDRDAALAVRLAQLTAGDPPVAVPPRPRGGAPPAPGLAARCEAFGLSATVGEHDDGNRGAALSVVAVAPGD